MKNLYYAIAVALLFSSGPVSAQYDDPREAARKAAEQSMAKARADKARNDAIVQQQRAAERAKARTPTPSLTPKGRTNPQ